MFLRNRVSGFTTQQLAHKATKAGASGVDAFAKAGTSGRHRGNISRDLLRKMLRGCRLPLLYWALIPMRDPKTEQNNVLTWMPFLLVHEVLAALWDVLGDALYEPSPTVEKNLKASCKSISISKWCCPWVCMGMVCQIKPTKPSWPSLGTFWAS